MALEGLRGYLVLASGLTEVSRQRAREVAQSFVSSTSGLDQAIRPLGKQAQQITEDLIATSRSNRDLLLELIRGEVERGIAALGLPSHKEIARLERRVERVESAVAAGEGSPARPTRKVSSPPKKAAASTTQRPSTATRKGASVTKESASGEQARTPAMKKSTAARRTRPVTAAKKAAAPATSPTLVRPELDFAAAAPVDGAATTASDPDQAVGGTA